VRALEHSSKETFTPHMKHFHPHFFTPMHRLYILNILHCVS
jgi:hypothetical protein